MLQIRDIMTTDLVTVGPQTTLREAMELLARHHISGAPVIAGDTLVGVVTGNDLMEFAASLSGIPTERDTNDSWAESISPSIAEPLEQEDEPASMFFSEMWDDSGAETGERMASVAGPEWNVLEEHDVSEVMTRAPLVTLGASATLDDAAELMRQKRIHRVLVTDGDLLVGLVSALDIVTAAAQHRFTKRTYVFNTGQPFDGRR
jgi:CBS domain-containing protein